MDGEMQMQLMAEAESLYSEYDIDPQYDDPGTYGKADSWYGDGKYPPDWGARRAAIWDSQKYWCGRCGRYKQNVDGAVCHHVRHLSDGGSNHLDNLVGLCVDCHSVMHPDNPDVDGKVSNAPLFPDSAADDRVSVIHTVGLDNEQEFDIDRLSTEAPEINRYAVSSVCKPLPARLSKMLNDGTTLSTLLIDRGFVPRSTEHNRVYVSVDMAGVAGVLSPASARVEAETTASVMEVVEDSADDVSPLPDPYESVIYTTPEPATIDINVFCGDTQKQSGQVELHSPPLSKGYQATVAPPPVTVSNAPHYLAGIGKHLVGKGAVTTVGASVLTAASLNPVGKGLLAVLLAAFVFTMGWLGVELWENADTETGETRETVSPQRGH